MMAAGLQGYIQGCAPGRFGQGCKGIPLCMGPAEIKVAALSDDTALPDNDSTCHGIGADLFAALSGQFQCDGHVIRIVQCGASFTNDGTPMAQPWPVLWFTAVKTAIKNALNRYRSRQKI